MQIKTMRAAILVEQKKGMLKLWNVILISLTYWLTILGVCIVRSGIIQESVHTFAESPIGYWLLGLTIFVFIGSLTIIILKAKNIKPKDKYIRNNNPPKLIIDFFKDQKNLKHINCFSDEGNKWNKSEIVLKENKLTIHFREKFLFRRGRINCSLNDTDGWRWFGLQFSVKLN